MGMFDYFFSSYDLGESFTKVECQTKDICPSGLGGTMTQYWLDPDGHLHIVDYSGTHDFQAIPKTDPRYSHKKPFLNFEWVPTGKHGKLKNYGLTKYIKIYPSAWSGNYKEWPTLMLHFKKGKLVEFHDITDYEDSRAELY